MFEVERKYVLQEGQQRGLVQDDARSDTVSVEMKAEF